MADLGNNLPVDEAVENEGFATALMKEIFTSPLNVGLLCVCAYLLYKIFAGKPANKFQPPPRPPLPPPMKKRDFTLAQLREYTGEGPDGRVLLGVNGHVYDVTAGKHFYGKGGPYSAFAGRDASRGFATFSVNEDSFKDEYDDLSDLNSSAIESMKEWEMQIKEKYIYVGRLLKPGEEAREYTDTEEADDSTAAAGKKKDN